MAVVEIVSTNQPIGPVLGEDWALPHVRTEVVSDRVGGVIGLVIIVARLQYHHVHSLPRQQCPLVSTHHGGVQLPHCCRRNDSVFRSFDGEIPACVHIRLVLRHGRLQRKVRESVPKYDAAVTVLDLVARVWDVSDEPTRTYSILDVRVFAAISTGREEILTKGVLIQYSN